jgi:uncharacterized membrane protein YdjX (TVP38/TMEM64 family)
MNRPLPSLRRALTWAQLWPSLRAGLLVVALFGAALWLARQYEAPIMQALNRHAALGAAVFVGTSVLAVLAPMLTNLPLMPLAVIAWGPWWTAGMLLSGWIAGSALAFTAGRHARGLILRRLPSVQRHAGIERLIDPRHRMLSLILLRMTFPVDVLSYALGLFSQHTTLAQTMLSTALGAAPFAVLFSLFPTLSGPAQWGVFGASLAAFVLYLGWVLHRPAPGADSAGA